MQNDFQKPTTLEPNTPNVAETNTEKTLAAVARARARQPEAVPVVAPDATPTSEAPPSDETPPDEQATTQMEPVELAEPPRATPAPEPPPVTTPGARHLPADSDQNALTYRDLPPPFPPPYPPLNRQAPPMGQARQPSPRLPYGNRPAPLPTHAPWQVASSWGATTLNIQANTAAGASYLLWWLSGLLVYFNERHNRFVRFHAMQSILLTGALSVYSVLAYFVTQLCYDLAAATHQHAFHTIGTTIAALSYLAVIGVWLAAMIIAWSGTYLHWPILGKYAERYAAPPASPPQF